MGKRVLSIEQNEFGVMIRVADGSTHHGDILVGADGAYSGVRQGLYKLVEKKGQLPSSDKANLTMGYMSMVGMSLPQDPEKYPVLKEPSSNFSRVIGDGTPHSVRFQTILSLVPTMSCLILTFCSAILLFVNHCSTTQ